MKKIKIIIILLGFLCYSLTFAAQDASILGSSNNPYKIHAIVASESMATISSQMAGLISNLYVKNGSTFKKNDLLLQFDCREQLATLQKAKAEVKLAEVGQKSYARLSALGSASVLKVAESQAQLEKALGDQKIAEKKVSDCQIRAPFSGQVTELFVHQNESVQTYQKVFDVLDNSDLVVNVLVPSNWMSWLTVGSTFQLKVDETQQTYTVKVARIVRAVDAVSRSVNIIGTFVSAQPELQFGMSGDAIFTGPSK